MTSVETPRRILKASDRCDWRGCGAAAYHRLIYSAGVLDSCNHHLEEAPESLFEKVVYHIDESWSIP